MIYNCDFQNSNGESCFNASKLTNKDEDRERISKAIKKCLEKNGMGSNTQIRWVPLSEASGRTLTAVNWPYDDLSFYEKRWSYLLLTWSPKFRPFIILRNNIEMVGKMVGVKEVDPEIALDYTKSEKEILEQFRARLPKEESYSIMEFNAHELVRRSDYNFELPKEKTIPISFEEIASIPEGQSIYDTPIMYRIFQNCFSAELFAAKEGIMEMSISDLDAFYKKSPFPRISDKYKNIKLPSSILDTYFQQSPDSQMH